MKRINPIASQLSSSKLAAFKLSDHQIELPKPKKIKRSSDVSGDIEYWLSQVK